MLSPEYVAGLFDGEGMVSLVYINRRNCKMDPSKTIRGLRIAIGLSNTFKPVIYRIQEMFGGDVNCSNRKLRQPHHKLVWAWKVGGRDMAIRFLLAIQPFAIIKAEQIKLGLEYLETVGEIGHRINQENWNKRISIYNKLRIINRMGFERETTPDLPKKVKQGFRPKQYYSSEELSKKMEEMRDKIVHTLSDNPSKQALNARAYRARKKKLFSAQAEPSCAENHQD